MKIILIMFIRVHQCVSVADMDLSGQDYERPHHFIVFVLQVVAVPDIFSLERIERVQVNSGSRTSRSG